MRLEEAALLTAGDAAVLVEQAEGALLGLVALAGQVLQGLLAGGHLLAADNATVLVLHEVGLGQTTGSVLGSTMENLGLGTNSHHLGHLILMAAILTRAGAELKVKAGGPGQLTQIPNDGRYSNFYHRWRTTSCAP